MSRFKVFGVAVMVLLIASTMVYASGSAEEAADEDYKLVLRLSHVFNPAE